MATSTDTRRVIKLILVGNRAVGKTSLLSVYVDGTFPFQVRATIAKDIQVKNLVVDGNNVRLSIWDTGGEERFHALAPVYYRETRGALLVYDVTYRRSFKEIGTWMNALDRYCTTSDVVKVLVANKSDLKNTRQVTDEEGRRLAQKYNIGYFETSAKEKRGVEAAFEHLVNEIYRKDIEQEIEACKIDVSIIVREESIYLHEEITQQTRGCRC